MGITLMGKAHAKVQKIQKSLSGRPSKDVPKGHFAVYVEDHRCKKRFVVPIAYLNHPLFLDLLDRAEEEYGFEHPMGCLTIPCNLDYFITLLSTLNCNS